MKINVYYKEIKLGELSHVTNNYIYKANKQNIEKAHKKGYITFLYKCDDSFISEELPFSLQNLIPTEKQQDILLLADINKNDSDFEKLYKLSKLDLETTDFYVKS